MCPLFWLCLWKCLIYVFTCPCWCLNSELPHPAALPPLTFLPLPAPHPHVSLRHRPRFHSSLWPRYLGLRFSEVSSLLNLSPSSEPLRSGHSHAVRYPKMSPVCASLNLLGLNIKPSIYHLCGWLFRKEISLHQTGQHDQPNMPSVSNPEPRWSLGRTGGQVHVCSHVCPGF